MRKITKAGAFWLKGLVALSFCGAMTGAGAGVLQEVCARQGAGKPQQVQAMVASGSELNSSTNVARFAALSKYVVIFWAGHQSSFIEMALPTLGTLATSGRDQHGRRWDISITSLCS